MAGVHSQFPPSSAYRWMVCTASWAEEQRYPDETTDFAAEGSVAHALGEKTLKHPETNCSDYLHWRGFYFDDNDDSVPESLAGEAIIVNPTDVEECDKFSDMAMYEFEVDTEMVEEVQKYVDRVRHTVAGGDNGEKGDLFVEQRLPFTNWVEKGFGTVDAGIVLPAKKLIISDDLKYGKGVKVFAERNPQGMLYMGALIQELGYLYDPEQVEIRISQPRLNHFDSWQTSVLELLEFMDEVKAISQRILAGDVEFVPGEKQCKFCKHGDSGQCDAKNTFYSELVVEDFDFEMAPDQKRFPVLRNIDQMTVDEVGRVLPHVKGLRDWLNGFDKWIGLLEARGLKDMESGIDYPGLKRVLGGQARRYWKNQQEAEETLKSMRFKQDDMYTKKLVSPAKIEKVSGPRQWPKIQGLIGKTELKPIIVPVSDERPALGVMSDEFDFEDAPTDTVEEDDFL